MLLLLQLNNVNIKSRGTFFIFAMTWIYGSVNPFTAVADTKIVDIIGKGGA
jgi:hypothetical protein